MSQESKELLVIYPSEGYDKVYTLLVAKTGEPIANHFCSHQGFAKGDLYDNRPERKEKFKERFGEVEVKFLNETDISVNELMKRNKEWYENLPKEEKE